MGKRVGGGSAVNIAVSGALYGKVMLGKQQHSVADRQACRQRVEIILLPRFQLHVGQTESSEIILQRNARRAEGGAVRLGVHALCRSRVIETKIAGQPCRVIRVEAHPRQDPASQTGYVKGCEQIFKVRD